MTDTINFFDNPEGLVNWLILCSIGHLTTDTDVSFDDLGINAEAIEVKMMINGREVPFVKLVEEIESQHHSIVIEEAKKLVALKLSGLNDKLYDLEELLTEKVDEVMRELEKE